VTKHRIEQPPFAETYLREHEDRDAWFVGLTPEPAHAFFVEAGAMGD